MRKLLECVFDRYGVDSCLGTRDGTYRTKALLRVVKSDAWQSAQREFLPLGEVPRGRYICLLPAQVPAAPGNTVTVRGKSYILRRVEDVALFTQIVGHRCLCVEKGDMRDGT